MVTVNNMLEFLDYFHDYYKEEEDFFSAYNDSIKRIAKVDNRNSHKISEQCRRKLGLDNVNQFQDLLKNWTNNNSEDLIKALKNNSASASQGIIDEFFDNHSFNGNGKSKDSNKQKSGSKTSENQNIKPDNITYEDREYSVYLNSENAKKISILSILTEKSVSDLLTEMVHESINQRLREWAHQIIEG